VLPSTFRARFAEGAYLTYGKDGCIEVWTPEAFERRGEELTAQAERNELDRAELRAFFHNAFHVTPDGQGRILVGQDLRDFAGLRQGVAVAGTGDHVELWDPDLYEGEQARGAALRSRSQRPALASLTDTRTS